MHTRLLDLVTGRDLDDLSNVNETLNDARSSITSDSVLKSTASASETLSKTLNSSKEPHKSYAIPVGCDEKPPSLPFGILFFAHLG